MIAGQPCFLSVWGRRLQDSQELCWRFCTPSALTSDVLFCCDHLSLSYWVDSSHFRALLWERWCWRWWRRSVFSFPGLTPATSPPSPTACWLWSCWFFLKELPDCWKRNGGWHEAIF